MTTVLNRSIYALALALGTLATPVVTLAEKPAPSFGECENIVTEEQLRKQVADGARASIRAAAQVVDYRAIVLESWSAVRFDDKFERIIDAQIAILKQDRAYLERLLDGNVPSRAEEMAKKTAEAVFTSAEFLALQTELQDEIGRRMQPMVAGADLQARNQATECVRVFLGRRYATTVSTAFGEEARAARIKPEFKVTAAGTAAVFSLAGIVTGLLTIVFRRLVRRIVAAVVRRLAGAIAARLAAWASVVLGAALLVYELVVGAEGVFPVIREELTSPKTRQTIQASLVEELSSVAPQQLEGRADEIANNMIVSWRRFKEGHRAVLELSARNERFRTFVEDQPPEAFERLSVIVQAIKAVPPGGDEAVVDALDRGLLSRALQMPDIVELSETWTPLGVSIVDLLRWKDRTGDRFEAALAARLPLHVDIETLPQPALERLLALGDERAAGRISAMKEPARAEALQLPTATLLNLATRFDSDQLSGLLDAVRPAENQEARAQMLKTVLDRPGLIGRLKYAGDAIAASDKPAAALAMLLSSSSVWDPQAVIKDLQVAADGDVTPMVIVYRYGWVLLVLFGVPLFTALWILRKIGAVLGIVR